MRFSIIPPRISRRLLLAVSVALAALVLLSLTALATRSRFHPAVPVKAEDALPPVRAAAPVPAGGVKHAPQGADEALSVSVSAGHVRRGSVMPRLLRALGALGDRLEKTGKERTSYEGTFQAEGAADSAPLAVLRESPDRLRIEMRNGAGRDVTVFDGGAGRAAHRPPAQVDEGLIESLVYDTADYFFLAQAGGAVRHLGSGFRPDGAAEEYAGPTYEVYQVSFPVRSSGRAEQRTKTYYFNSATSLLELVRYTVERGGYETEVEVRLSGWQRSLGQSFPARVERLEGGRPVWALTLALSGVGAAARDGAFSTH